jgi:hypothetical protein
MNDPNFEFAAKSAAIKIITEHGWPWELNEDGDIETVEQKAHAMLTLAFVMGHRDGYQEHIDLVDETLSRLERRMRP